MRILLFSLASIFFFSAKAQNEDILKPINQLFLAMETNDGDLAARQFTGDATLSTVTEDSTGSFKLSQVPANKLAQAFNSPKDKTWREPIWNEIIHQDGGFATVWVSYAFYLDSTLSHCGVDAFQLIWKENKWKIFSIVDTRHIDCQIPKDIQKSAKGWE